MGEDGGTMKRAYVFELKDGSVFRWKGQWYCLVQQEYKANHDVCLVTKRGADQIENFNPYAKVEIPDEKAK